MKNLFKEKKVLVMGLGLNGGGVGVAKFFCKQEADVLVTDLKTAEQLKESLNKLKNLKIKYTLGKHEEADFMWPDLIIKNPDVPNSSPYLEIARKKNIEIETDVSLFFKMYDAFIIGVTGTKGKSTTASLIYHILKTKFKKTFLAGNIGVSPLELLDKIQKDDKVVLELSSFELENLTQSPDIAVVTNIMPDHLNRYAGMAEYIEAKKLIFKFQNNNDALVLNADDSIVRQFAKSTKAKVYYFSTKQLPKDIKLDNFKLFGKHNLSNLLAAIEVAKILEIPAKTIEKSLKTFKGVPNRQELAGEINGVKYFNDTTATMPEAAIAAIKVFADKFPKSKLIFICGGMNKGLEYGEMIEKIKKYVNFLIMLPGTGSDKIKAGLHGYDKIYDVPSMEEAVKKAHELAKKGDAVVLSPGATSFNLFKNEFDRGKQFVEALKKL